MTKTEIKVIGKLLTKGHFLVTDAKGWEMRVAQDLLKLRLVTLARVKKFPGCFHILPIHVVQEQLVQEQLSC